ncbi:MAG: hypothetical protein RLZZ58_982 [Pseudomonadota bacterium]
MNDLTVMPPDGGAMIPRPAVPFGRDWFADLRRHPALARALPFAIGGAALAAALLVWALLSAPVQRDLVGAASDADKAAITAQLDTSGIAYQVDATSGALSVSADDYHRARMALAAAGLPKSAPSGESMLASVPMGTSRAVESERLRQVRENDLARTIEAIDAIRQARVHLAVETPSAFVRDASRPAASVMLTLADGRTLSNEQVRAITHLVSSSVPGLSPDMVSVVDQDGRLVSGEAALDGAADQQLRLQSAVADRYRRSLAAMLTPIVGARNFTAEVSVDLDFDERQATRESFPGDDARVVREAGKWSADRDARPAYGIPGALSNAIPPDARLTTTPPGTPASGTGTSAVTATDGQRSSEEFQRSFELGRETSVTKSATGTVKRLTVAVALANPKGAKPRSRAEIAAIEQLVKNAVGFDAARGDQMTVSARAFAADTAAADASWWQAEWIEPLVRNISALLVVLLLLGGGLVAARRWQRGAAARQADLAMAALAVRDGSPGAATGDPAITLDMIAAAPSYAARGELVRRFVRQDPERAALVVRQLLGRDKAEAAA